MRAARSSPLVSRSDMYQEGHSPVLVGASRLHVSVLAEREAQLTTRPFCSRGLYMCATAVEYLLHRSAMGA